ncbi:MAG: DUF1570 domain-containing protein [Planctomycetota bacterium]|nr:DUF1570 domain-containing protein [Planctomycetota bacterium]
MIDFSRRGVDSALPPVDVDHSIRPMIVNRLWAHSIPAGRGFRPVFLAGLWMSAGLVGCTSEKTAVPVFHFDEREWNYRGIKGTELESMHYVLRTTCRDEDFVAYIPMFLEECWGRYSKFLPTDYVLQEPSRTYLFQRRIEWERFTDDFAPSRAAIYKRIKSGGYSERGVTVSQYSNQKSTLSVLAHEGLHQYLELTHGKPIPPWLNEGLACYFEGFHMEKGRPVFTPEFNTTRSSSLRLTLAHGQLIPLRKILGTHAGREIQEHSTHVRTYYAQIWALVVYLLQPAYKNPYHDGFQRLLNELGTETMRRKANAYLAADTEGEISQGEAIFLAYVSEDIDAFEVDFEAFVRNMLGMEF